MSRIAVLLMILIATALAAAPASASCPSTSSFYSSHCYGTVTSTCTGGVYTYNVTMKPGYLCGGLYVYTMSPQSIVGTGSPVSPPGAWSTEKCSSTQFQWMLPTSGALASASGFKLTMNSCSGNRFIGLHVVPIASQHPYVPPGVPNTFHAAAGCTTPVAYGTWGRIRSLYR